MRLFTGFQSAWSTGASCAFHCVCFELGVNGRMIRCFPLEKSTWSDSGLQHSVYTVPSPWPRLARNMPTRDHDLTTPSSPHVASDVLSCDHRTHVTAPWCAGTDFSIWPRRETSLNEPSVQPTTNESAFPWPPGAQSSPVQNESIVKICACGSPSMFHSQTVLSSETESSSFAADQSTPVTTSLCFVEDDSASLREGMAAAARAAQRPRVALSAGIRTAARTIADARNQPRRCLRSVNERLRVHRGIAREAPRSAYNSVTYPRATTKLLSPSLFAARRPACADVCASLHRPLTRALLSRS